MLEFVRSFAAAHRMFHPGTKIGVAVSGGADSVCLLHILHQLATDLSVELRVLHLNHQLRGTHSDADQQFVATLAENLGLPFTSVSVDVLSLGGNLEQTARDVRREFFRGLIRNGVVSRVATGHTRSDQAETVLYRLLRGSGTAGLSGIHPVTGENLVRPLLSSSRSDVLEFLHSAGLEWREDATNVDTTFVRNRIRHNLLPLLAAEYQTGVSEILAGTARLALDEEDYWSHQTDIAVQKIAKERLASRLVDADELNQLHPALKRRVVRRIFGQVKGDLRSLDLDHVDRVLALAAAKEGHGRTQVPGLDILRSFEWLLVRPLQIRSRQDGNYAWRPELELNGTVRYGIPGGESSICLERLGVGTDASQGAYNGVVTELDWEALPAPLELRNWYPGDEMELPGRSRSKLKFLFGEFRVPIWDRSTWPVLTAGNAVVWARRFGASERYRKSGESRVLLRIVDLEPDAPVRARQE